MKKLLLMVAMILLTGMAGFSQIFEKGSQAINLGIGFGNTSLFWFLLLWFSSFRFWFL